MLFPPYFDEFEIKFSRYFCKYAEKGHPTKKYLYNWQKNKEDMNEHLKKVLYSVLPYLTLLCVITLILSYQLNSKATFISSDA